jgi:glucan phosphoethanolaminetransferase (alkaline phosphatase superfamily)
VTTALMDRAIDRGDVITITTRATARRQPTMPQCCPAVAAGRSRVVTSRATYWRRRVLVAAMVVALVLVMAQAGAALGGSSLAAPERRPAAAHTSARSTVVRPGDSLWSVASRLAPGSDPRPVVDALAEARHGTVLVVGETIRWDG